MTDINNAPTDKKFKLSSIKSAALAYSRAGLKIYPSPRKDGAAYVKWKEASTSDAATIEQWWTKWPDALICLDCGKSEIGVIDVDTLEGHNVDGVKSLLEVEIDNGFLPLTRRAQSPSKGVHYFFRRSRSTAQDDVRQARQRSRHARTRWHGRACTVRCEGQGRLSVAQQREDGTDPAMGARPRRRAQQHRARSRCRV